MNSSALHIWINFPSYYQNDLFNELTKNFEKFEVIYAHAKDENRLKQGWNFGNIQHYKSKTIGIDLSYLALISYVLKHRKATHIVNGIWAEKSFLFALILLNIFRVNFLIYSEAPIPVKQRSYIKKIIINFLLKPFAKILLKRAKGFLAVSIFAVEYFESLGVNIDKIYRFGYFGNVINHFNFLEIEHVKPKGHEKSKLISLIFVGQLIERKGILLLLKAIRVIAETNQNFHLNIIGIGKLATILGEFIDKHHLQNKITLLGAIQSDYIADYIEKADLLILPSIFDGWGMVVNEALQSGVPVLISDKCGAKELINHKKNGLIFKGNDLESLMENLKFFFQLSPTERSSMKNYAGEIGEKISIPIVSKYLSFCLNHCLEPQQTKPTTPWLNE